VTVHTILGLRSETSNASVYRFILVVHPMLNKNKEIWLTKLISPCKTSRNDVILLSPRGKC